eukprot:TRINITY_DN9979_c0_g1_i12.p1 TRINITY_DN9979_c0_g1~~TRINITY_DN9979_c0_g1_i12.p1  ORF type:complete len:481 (-),score=73.44 TRINITY_DN9979_c0_g1_i12:1296-2738(-)
MENDSKGDDILRADSLQSNGKYKQAMQIYNQIIEEFEGSVDGSVSKGLSDAFFRRGVLHDWKGNPEQALSDITNAIKIHPEMGNALVYRGFLCEKLGQYEESLSCYTNAANGHLKLDALILRGILHHKLKDYREALSDASEAIKIDESNPLAWIVRGDTYKCMGVQHEALKDYSHALDLDIEGARKWIGKGFSFDRFQEFVDIMDQYIKSIRVKPKEEMTTIDNDSDHPLERTETYNSLEEDKPALVLEVEEDSKNASPIQPEAIHNPFSGTKKEAVISRAPSRSESLGSSWMKKSSSAPNTQRTQESRVSIVSTKLNWEAARNYRRPWTESAVIERNRRPPSAPFSRNHTKDYEAIRKRLRPKTAPAGPFRSQDLRGSLNKSARQVRTPSPTATQLSRKKASVGDDDTGPRKGRPPLPRHSSTKQHGDNYNTADRLDQKNKLKSYTIFISSSKRFSNISISTRTLFAIPKLQTRRYERS